MQSDTEIAVSVAKTPKKALQIALSKLTFPLKIPEKGIDEALCARERRSGNAALTKRGDIQDDDTHALHSDSPVLCPRDGLLRR